MGDEVERSRMGVVEYYWDGKTGQVYSLPYCEKWPNGKTVYELHNVYDAADIRKIEAEDLNVWMHMNIVNEMQVIALAPR